MTLSVIVTIVDGGPALTRCLDALMAQEGAPPLEVLVPFDDSVPAASIPSARYPHVRFVKIGVVHTDHEPTVHGALLEQGETIFLSPDPVVDQLRGDLNLGTLSKEHLAWGRMYATVRASDARWFERLARAMASALLPGLLFYRLLRDRL